MARAILLAGAVAWLLSFVIGVALALFGVEGLLRLLPPLAIDADAVRGAVVAVSIGLGVGAVAHLAVLGGMRAGRRGAWSAATLLCGVLAAVFLVLSAAAFTSAAASSASPAPLLAAGVISLALAALYGVATARVVAELRA